MSTARKTKLWNWKEWLMNWRAGLLFRQTSISWRRWASKIPWRSKASARPCTWNRASTCSSSDQGLAESSFAENLQVEHESAMCPGSKGGQEHPKLPEQEGSQQDRGTNHCPPVNTDESGCRLQCLPGERHSYTAASPANQELAVAGEMQEAE